MDNRDSETLSAMLDNEADELELRRMLKTASENPQVADAWQRMCLIQALIQALLHDDNLKASRQLTMPGNDFSAKVMQAIADEPVPNVADGKALQWKQPLAKLSLAASVALAFFLGMQITVNQPEGGVSLPVVQQQSVDEGGKSETNPTLLATAADSGPVESVPREVDPEARQRLEEYIQSVSITRDEPPQLEQPQDSPLYRLVNEIQDSQ